ncbi:MAG: N-acetylmuramoyl-L-alanine amidase [Armatimonadota bacterium]
MHFHRIVVLALLAVLLVTGIANAQEQEGFRPQAFSNVMEWDYELGPIFEAASVKYQVPLPLLLALGHFGSAFENRGDAPTIEGGYGIMALRQNDFGGTSLAEAAALTGASEDQLKRDARTNIMGAAAVLDAYAKQFQVDRSAGLDAWLDVIIKYAAIDKIDAENPVPVFNRMFAMEVYQKLQAGVNTTNSMGEQFNAEAQNIGSIDLASLEPPEMKSKPNAGYSGAIWYPAASCNYSAVNTSKSVFVVHTIEGTASGCLGWFRNCAAQTSAHYVCSEAGTVWQMVDEWHRAWHVGCANNYCIGCEHEGYASSPSHPTSLYNASALLARDVCNRWGIPKVHNPCQHSILGHVDVNNCWCGPGHTDPGAGWNWGYYIQQVGGAPPPPTWAATYVNQSYPATLNTGETAIVWAEFKNTGTGSWTHANTYLGTSSPQDRSSPFYNPPNWDGPNRPSDVDQWQVKTNEVGRFTFILKAPNTPGTYTEKYKLVQEGAAWFGPEITWTITVKAATGNITGTVRNSANNAALSGVAVTAGGASATTNASGVYTFSGLAPGSYTVNVSKAGFTSQSASVTVTAGQTTTKDFSLVSTDTTAPTNPSGLTATGVSPSQIDLSWTASTDSGGSGLAGYIVYRNGAEVGRTASTTYSDNGLSQNTNYSYYVKAYDNAANVSGQSNTASAATKPGSVPIFEDGFTNANYWQPLQQSPMSKPNGLVISGERNHGTFAGGNSFKAVDSGDPNLGSLSGHTFSPAFAAAKYETWFYDGSESDSSRQGLQVRCLDGNGGLKTMYYVGTYSTAPGAFNSYSVGYYKACGAGCTGWYWQGAVKTRSVGWHKFTIDIQPYTGAGNEVTFYIDGAKVGNSVERTIDTQIYGLTMVAYGYHYRVNQAGWFDDCAMYAQPPATPTMNAATALSTTAIRWNVKDNSNNEMGFKVQTASQATVATATVANATGSVLAMDESGLTPNTSYTRFAKAFNGTLDSLPSANATKWTLSVAPTTSNVTCNKPTGTSSDDTFKFTAVGGFGAGTLAKYQYAWDTSPTHTWTGSEATWNSGDLILKAPAQGNYYLHVKGFNGENVANGTLDLGPYGYFNEPPTNPTSVTETHGVQTGTWQSTVSAPSFTWSGATASAGIAGYLVYFGPDSDGTSTELVNSAAYTPAAVDAGTYYLRLRTKDNVGQTATKWMTAFEFKYDSSAPEAPVVSDDGDFTGSATKLHGVWYASDEESGIAEYQYAVGTSAGAADVVNWTSAGDAMQADISIPGQGLQTGVTYYISAKAKNAAGLWSAVGSSDGINLAPAVSTIAEAKLLPNATPVALVGKRVTASYMSGFYIEEDNRTSGIMVLSDMPPARGSVVTVGGMMGENATGERAILNAVVTVEAAPDVASIPAPLYITTSALGGGMFGAYTKGKDGGTGLNNVGLLIKATGRVTSVGEWDIDITDGAVTVSVLGGGFELPALAVGDFVSAVGISSLEFDSELKPVIRLIEPSGLVKLN